MDRAMTAANNASNSERRAAATAAKADTAVERRAAVRSHATDLPQPPTCRITPGHDVRIVNLSAVGLLVESTSPLFPGRTVTLQLQAGARRLVLNGLVVRGCMIAVDRDRGARFVSGIAFDRRVDLEGE
jgi:hypothetical protein